METQMVLAVKKIWKLKNRRSLRFTAISLFATIALARMHPALAQTTERTVMGNNLMSMGLSANILEILAGSLLAISLVLAIVGMYLRVKDSNNWEATGMSLLGLLLGLFLVIMGSSLFLESWTPALVTIALLNGGGFLVILILALIP